MCSEQALPAEQSTNISVERFAKTLTYALPLVYFCGFVILSLYEAEFGIADLSLVRVKALASGIVFVFFIAYPSLVGMRAFQLLGLKKPGIQGVEVGKSKSDELYFKVIRVLGLYMIACYVSGGLGVMFVPRIKIWYIDGAYYMERPLSVLTVSAWLMCFASAALGIFSSLVIGKQFSTKPKTSILLSILACILFGLLNFRMFDGFYFELVGWFFCIALSSVVAAHLIQSGKGLKAENWELWVFLAFVTFIPWFARSLYGKIKPAFGGGSPVSVRMYLSQDNVLLGGKTADVLIVEETEQGYYVVNPAKDPKRAIMVPRSSVVSAQFGSATK